MTRRNSSNEVHAVDEVPDFANQVLDRTTRPAMEATEAMQQSVGSFLRSRRAGHHAREIGAIRSRLVTGAENHVRRAVDLMISAGNERMPDADYREFRSRASQIADLSRIDTELGKLEAQYRSSVRVVAEPGPYDRESEHSWIADTLAAQDPMGGLARRADPGAEERLRRHVQDVARAVEERSNYGQRIVGMLRESCRQEDATVNKDVAMREIRALTTGGGATASAASGAAAFVPPAIILDAWTAYRSPYRAFADQCDRSVALPRYGLQCYVPIVTTGTTVATHSEGAGVAEGDPVTSFASGAVVEKSGQITVSEAFLNRAGPGISGDTVLFKQLREQLDAQVDLYVINQALATAQSVAGISGSFTLTTASGVGGFTGDLRKAKNLLHDTAGTRLRGTHAFATGDLVDYIAAYADAQGRPVFSPTHNAHWLPTSAQGDLDAEGFSGYVIGGLALFADDNINTVGTAALNQVIVTRPSTILLLEGEVVPYLYPQGAAGNLESILGVREYVTAIPRYPNGVAAISGFAYAASNFA
jgi:hypothetical protein